MREKKFPLRLHPVGRRDLRWEVDRPCVSKETKPEKIDPLIVRQISDCACLQKEKEKKFFRDLSDVRRRAAGLISRAEQPILTKLVLVPLEGIEPPLTP